MARIEASVEIKRPADKVFAYTTEAKNWPRWQTIIPEAEQTSAGKIAVGATFKGSNRLMGLSMKWTAKVSEYKPNSKWSKKITSGSVKIEEQMNFKPKDEGVKFTIVYDMKIGGFLKLFSPMVVSTMRKETKKSLINLKTILEAPA